MQVNLQTQCRRCAQPSFGMAKLTQRGLDAAKDFISDLPTYSNDKLYSKPRVLKSFLKGKQGVITPDSIKEIFSHGQTSFADKNAEFVNKQIMSLTSRKTINKFLKSEGRNIGDSGNLDMMSENGKALVGSIMDLFDKNVANKRVSRTKGVAMLDLIKKYIDPEAHSKRAALVMDKLYSKR